MTRWQWTSAAIAFERQCNSKYLTILEFMKSEIKTIMIERATMLRMCSNVNDFDEMRCELKIKSSVTSTNSEVRGRPAAATVASARRSALVRLSTQLSGTIFWAQMTARRQLLRSRRPQKFVIWDFSIIGVFRPGIFFHQVFLLCNFHTFQLFM